MTAALALVMLLVATVVARAEDTPEPNPEATLALEDVLASVRIHHPLLLAEHAALARSQAEQLAARGEFDTVLSVQARATPLGYYDPKRIDVILEQPTPLLGLSVYGGYRLTQGKVAPYYGEQNTLDRGELRGGVRLPLLQDRGIDTRRGGLRTAEAEARAAEQVVSGVMLDLTRDAASAYFAWGAAGQRLRVLSELVELARFRDSQIQTKVKLGALPNIEHLDNMRSLLERERQLVAARRSFEKASIDLSLYLRDDGGNPRVANIDELPAEREREPTPGIRARAEQTALEHRPELRAYEQQVQAARVERELASNRVAPRLDAFVEVSRDFGDRNDALAPTLRPAVLEVGATFSFPLWLRKARGKLRASEAKLRALQEKARFAEDKVLAARCLVSARRGPRADGSRASHRGRGAPGCIR